MGNEFINKLNNQEYISKGLYNNTLKNQKELIPSDFNLEQYNENVLEQDYIKYKDYFENMYKGIDDSIVLDKEQSKAILADEESALIIAGAGTGKTTTMTSKVKYLVDIKNVDPTKILVMSYTRKAVQELNERIVGGFNIPAKVQTFHSLGYKYIREIYKDRKCSIVGYNDRKEIFVEYIKEKFNNKKEMTEIINTFQPLSKTQPLFSKYFVENYQKYETYEEFFESYKTHKILEAKKHGIDKVIDEYKERNLVSENIKTIKGEFVKSSAEMIIANFLFQKGLHYEYEEVYSEIFDGNRTYRPDFTLDLAGIPVYLEYYGLDDINYNKIKQFKREHHNEKKNLYIELDRTRLHDIERELDKKLKDMGFVYKEKTNVEVYEKLLENNPTSQLFRFEKFLYNTIDKIKESPHRGNYETIVYSNIKLMSEEEQKKAHIQFKYINEFYKIYQIKLYGNPTLYLFDYPDLLYYSHMYLDILADSKVDYEYIIIDEYQDISKSRYELARKTANKSGAKIFAVGDDWQSIYAFSGARIEYLYNFDKYFKNSKFFKISKTYRNSQQLIDYSGKFIMKNKSQIKKDLTSDKENYDPIKFVIFNQENSIKRKHLELEKLKETILEINRKTPDDNILILGRTNYGVDSIFNDKELKDDLDTKVTFVGHEDIEIEAMTMHKSKGLTFDQVIVTGLNNKFPISMTGIYWLEELFSNSLYDEEIDFAEERRLFYVALTRTKNNVYLLTDYNTKNRSPFLDELLFLITKNKEKE